MYQVWGEGSGVASLMRQSKESMSRTSFTDRHRIPTQDLCSARCLESLDNFTFGCVFCKWSPMPWGLELGSLMHSLPSHCFPAS